MNLRPILFIIFVIGFCCNAAAESLTDSVRVHFRVNQTVIDTLLMGNADAMQGFAKRMSDLSDLSDKSDLTVKIERILITGSASPEGSATFNEYLSRERAEAITRWLHGCFEFPDSLPQFVYKGSDWHGLLMAVIGDPDVPHKKEVIEILYNIVKCPPPGDYIHDNLKRLRAVGSGEAYRYLARRHFPSLRASEVFIEAEITQAEPLSDLSDKSDMSDEPDKPMIEVSDSIAVLEVSDLSDLSDLSDMSDMSDNRGFIFALKTNLLYDATATPNIGAEFSLGRHFSVGGNWMYAWWHNHDRNRHWRIYGGDINARYYFGSDRPLTGHHVGVYGQVLVFQIAFGGKGYITGIPGENLWGKPYIGGGIEYGWSKQIGKRLNIDFTLGLGYMAGEYREYRPVDGHYVWQSSRRRNWIGPTKAEISLVWLIGKMPKPVGTHGSCVREKGGGQ